MNKNDSQDRVFLYYKQFDPTIDLSNKSEARRKTL